MSKKQKMHQVTKVIIPITWFTEKENYRQFGQRIKNVYYKKCAAHYLYISKHTNGDISCIQTVMAFLRTLSNRHYICIFIHFIR